MTTPRVGQLLYRGCACDDFARVLRVGEDDNGRAVLDVELCDQRDLNDIFATHGAGTDLRDLKDEDINLTYIELPPGTRVVIKDVPWAPDTQGWIKVFFDPDGMHCHRCTRMFKPHDEGQDPWDK